MIYQRWESMNAISKETLLRVCLTLSHIQLYFMLAWMDQTACLFIYLFILPNIKIIFNVLSLWMLLV